MKPEIAHTARYKAHLLIATWLSCSKSFSISDSIRSLADTVTSQ